MSARFNQFFLAGLLGGAAYVAAAILGPDLVAVGLDASLLSRVPVPAWYAIAGAILGLVIGAEIDRFRQRRDLIQDIKSLTFNMQDLRRQLLPTIRSTIQAIKIDQTAKVGEVETKLAIELGFEDLLFVEFRARGRNVRDDKLIVYRGVAHLNVKTISDIRRALEDLYADQFDGRFVVLIRNREGTAIDGKTLKQNALNNARTSP